MTDELQPCDEQSACSEMDDCSPDVRCSGEGGDSTERPEKERMRHAIFSQAVKRALLKTDDSPPGVPADKKIEKNKCASVLTAQELKFLLG